MSDSRAEPGSARQRRYGRGQAMRQRRLLHRAATAAARDGCERGDTAEACKDGSAAKAVAVALPHPGLVGVKGRTTSDLWAKAKIAAQSAQALLERGDTDGAVNRAYYAVFGGTRAALASVRAALTRSKGHGTIFTRFDRYVIEERGFDRTLGKPFFHRQSHARWVADYAEGQVDEATARTMVAEMERFLAAVEPFLKRVKR